MLFPVLYIGSRFYYRCKTISPMDMDFTTGLKEIEDATYDEPVPTSRLERFWAWLVSVLLIFLTAMPIIETRPSLDVIWPPSVASSFLVASSSVLVSCRVSILEDCCIFTSLSRYPSSSSSLLFRSSNTKTPCLCTYWIMWYHQLHCFSRPLIHNAYIHICPVRISYLPTNEI